MASLIRCGNVLGKTERVEIGIVQDDPKPNQAILKAADVAAWFPTDGMIDRIAHMADRVVERIAGKRLPLRVLQLDAETACARCGEIDEEPIATEFQGARQQFSASPRG